MVAAARYHPLGKCIATTSLLAYIITSKYADRLPSIASICRPFSHEIGRNTMANWVIRLDGISPLIKLAREQQNQGNYIQVMKRAFKS